MNISMARRPAFSSGRVAPFLRRLLLYVVIAFGAVAFAIPFLWQLRTAFMPPWQLYIWPPEWIPRPFILKWFGRAFTPLYQGSLDQWLWNSFVISTLAAFGATMSSALVGFSFARLRFPGRHVLFLVVLATMILPRHVLLIPTYLLFAKLGWVGSYKPLIVPTYLAPAFYVFLLRQFFMTIPKELDDSAAIDGCSPLGLFLRIHLPLSVSALGVAMILQFTAMWNSFLLPLLYLRDARQFPVSIGLQMLNYGYAKGQAGSEIQIVMAAAVLSILPPITLFFFAQRHFVQGIVITGIKG